MQFRDFEVKIPEGTESLSGQIEIAHGKEFGIFINNMSGLRSKVIIEINTKHCGEHILDSYDSKTVKNFVEDKVTFPFVYYTPNSPEAKKQKLYEIPEKYVGLVKVTFIPEMVKVIEPSDKAPTDSIHRASEFDLVIKPATTPPVEKLNKDRETSNIVGLATLSTNKEVKQTERENNETINVKEKALVEEGFVPNYTIASCIYLRLIPIPEQAPLSEINIPYHSPFPPVLR
jgi:hypothetical protein